MNEVIQMLLSALVGAVLVAVAGFVFAKSNARKVAEWISKLIVKSVLGNEASADEIEDAAGDWLIAVGNELKKMHEIGDEGDEKNP